jgi:hypothetical protein
MSFDRYRIARAIQDAKKIDMVALCPGESDQSRQAEIRKLINRQSSARVIMLIAVET